MRGVRGAQLLLVVLAGLAGISCSASDPVGQLVADRMAPDAAGYPPADSLAGAMTPEWSEFASRVDVACATNFNAGQAELATLDQQVAARGWGEDRAEAEYRFIQARHQQDTYDEIRSLGPPPAKSELFRRWLANVGRRAELMRAVGEGWLAGDQRAIYEGSTRILALKIDADWLGQHFGLQICTSNGPSNTLGEDADYLERVNGICETRMRRDYELWAKDKFSPDVAAATSADETLRISAVAPPMERYALRGRILELKESIDRTQARALRTRRVNRPAARANIEERIVRVRDRIAALGLPACAWPEQWQ